MLRKGRVHTKETFFKKIRKTISGCWHFTGPLNSHGYGAVGFHGKVIGAHRLSYILTRGEIPNGLLVCHKCDNPKCVNPDHLFIGTYKDNAQDMIKKGRRGAGHIHGENHWNARLNNKQVSFIRQSSLSAKNLAIAFGVSLSVIYTVRSHKTYKP